MNGSRNIWVILERGENGLRESSAELFSAARSVATASGGEVWAVLLGQGTGSILSLACAYGADTIVHVPDTRLNEYSTARYTAALTELIKKYAPDAVMLSATRQGKDLAPRLARRLGTGVTANCTELTANGEDGLICWNMPAPGGIMATILCKNTRPQMGTICPGAFKKPSPVWGRDVPVITENAVTLQEDTVTVLQRCIMAKDSEKDIADADIVVAGGRGLGSRENFQLVQRLAELLGGAVGASRAAVDSGWAEQKNLVGQTGRLIRPKLYIACGISGALQHTVGMADAECIVAINTDADAPIMAMADYAVIGDAAKTLQSIISRLETNGE